MPLRPPQSYSSVYGWVGFAMKSVEHRAVGDTAAAGALLHVGGTSADDSLVLSVGDVVALSGDFFASHPGTDHRDEDSHEQQEGLAPDDLFELAGIAGQRGAQPSTRDEIVCALKVLAVDGGFVDARFEPGGQLSDFQFTPTAAMTEVERRARDRFFGLGRRQWEPLRLPSRPTAPAPPVPDSRRSRQSQRVCLTVTSALGSRIAGL
jgi:hypothetical protein